MYRRVGKRLLDLGLVIPGLVVLAPVFAGLAVAVRLDSVGPIFFKHARVGFRGQPIKVWKFRTMVDNADKLGPAVTQGGDARITRVGSVLRHYKLDELPQLLNVLGGSLSLVGPRPEVRKYVDVYAERYQVILDAVKPGITDYAAIEFVDEESILAQADDLEQVYTQEILPQKIASYERYVADCSLATDLVLIFRTIAAIVR